MSKPESTSLVFANCKGPLTTTMTRLKRISNVESITPVTGRFDLVIKLRTNDPTKVFNAIQKIRSIKNVTHTQTALSFQKITNGDSGSREQPLAFALFKVNGTFQNVLRRLKSIPNLLEAHVIPGEFDVVASFHGYSQDEVLENSVEKLNTISGISASETLIAWNPSSTTTF